MSHDDLSRDDLPHDDLLQDVPVRRPAIPARAAWCGVPGILAGYALAVVGATIGYALSGNATGPVATLFSEMGLWTGMLGTVVFVSRRYGSASLRRDFGLEIRGTDVLWGFAAVAAALLVSEMVVLVFAGTKFAGTNDQIITQQKGHDAGLVILTLIVELGAPFFEELFFRGFLRTALQDRFGAARAVWLQAAFFGIAHVGESKTAAGNVTVVLALFLVGVVLGYTSKLTRRLGAGMLAHCLFNLVAVASVL
ncbi:MAG TPA: CPBP family intramembrane glutamic endopeptidase [Acidimicrobiales bacterium]|nr:CPBP family intramembrane glutamic endopeptidase [Acidimicrobiales bacterium]